MNGYNQSFRSLGNIIFYATCIFMVIAVALMVLNLYRASASVEIPRGETSGKQPAQIVQHSKYEDLIKEFKQLYIPLNIHKRSIFSGVGAIEKQYAICPECGAKVPIDAVECPFCGASIGKREMPNFNNLNERLRIKKIYRKPVELLFKGYMQLTDGVFVATINWAGRTEFKKIGEEIRGYKIVDFEKKVKEETTKWGGTEKIDQSQVTLEKDGSEKFILEISKVALEKEIYADIWDRKELKNYEVYIGSEILGNKVAEITPTHVIITKSDGEKIKLTKM